MKGRVVRHSGRVGWVEKSWEMKLVGLEQLHVQVFPKGTMMWNHWRISNTVVPP